MEIAEYRKQLEQFQETLNRELYRYYSGLEQSLNPARVYSDYSDLHNLDTFRWINGEIEHAPDSYPSRKKSLQKIRGLIIEQYLDARSVALSQDVAGFDSRSVQSPEGNVPVGRLPLLFARQRDAEKRRDLNRAFVRGLAESEEIRTERLVRLTEAAKELGFGSYLKACEAVTGIRYEELAAAFDPLLDASQAEYLDDLRVAAESALGIPFHEVHWCDLGYWLRTCERADVFRASGLRPSLEETIGRLGVQPERPGSISLDLDARPQKQPRAFCLPIRIPFEIKVVMLPAGGYADYASLFHESGHAHHFAWTGPDLPIEHRIHGDRALTEAYGFLLEGITRDRLWLLDLQNYSNSSQFLRSREIFAAYNVRRHIAMLKFEVQLYSGSDYSSAARIYSELLTRHTGVRHDPECWLADLDDRLYSADYLRGWIFETMLREHLRTKFGADWYQRQAAGKFLKEIWETGQFYSADELSREIGLGPLDPQVLSGG